MKSLFLVAALAGVFAGCGAPEAMNGAVGYAKDPALTNPIVANDATAPVPTPGPDTEQSTQPQKDAMTSADGSMFPKAGDEVAVIETAQGRIVFAFLPDKAPKTVASFKKLANAKFYDNTAFHRVIPGFMIQGGDPNSDPKRASGPMGTGGPGFSIPAEFNDTSHERGVVSMARSQDPNSAGSQFFVVVKKSDFLDNQYTAFGKVVSGMDVADKIVALERDASDKPNDIEKARVKTVRIAKWPLK